MFDILETVSRWLGEGQQVSLATVVQTWGSAPRATGSKMAVTRDMALAGSVSGGCIEGAVVESALEGMEDGGARMLTFGVSDDEAWDVGLTCGGKISVFVEPLDTTWWSKVSPHVRQHRPATSISLLEGDQSGAKVLLGPGGGLEYRSELLDDSSVETMSRGANARSGRHEIEGLVVLVDQHRPGPRLIIIGGVHVAMPLQKFARELGFRVTLIDPRRVFATAERFPDVDEILHSYPDKALRQIGLDGDTWLAVLTHDPKIDDPALLTALPGPAPYVGVLSSPRTHRQRLKRLHAAGLTPEQTSRIHTPIGLEIGSSTPEEIALSIMAEIVSLRSGVNA
ncbi:MAG: XdhC family protein [Anaerolineaceae bacterium]|nr:XdhC family protein [Anaerolineaceae bacterium]MDE0329895.1 XdhC family protein [Anaerolineaceae bacterium]